MAKIVCLSGANADYEYQLPSGNCEISFGRSDENDICVLDRKSSRFHCKLSVNNGEIVLEDLNSTNGVFVNHQQVSGRQKLAYGDFIGIGQTVFTILRDAGTDRTNNNVKSGIDLMKEMANTKINLFEVTKTTAFRRVKMEQSGSRTGFLSFFEKKNSA